MHRIDTKTAQKDKFGAGKNGFTRGNPHTGTPATDLDDDYFDMLQEELCGVVEASGASLEKGRHDQLLTALSALLLSRKNPFGDIKSDGTVKTALENLGLGEAAKREVGTGVNQIPDMASFTSGPGWMKFPDGTIIQFGVSIAGPIGYPTTVNFPIPFTSGYRIATSFDSAINGATDCPAFATTPAGGGLLAFYLMSSRTGGTGAGANWIAIGK
ncbi:hypothetical protein D9D20_17520 [Escherichia coli]|uniref:gp53-like domain-containing protein n=1 Tax=Escherichia coli TaxID=562 RepID=UPI000FB95516|nr:hypothetical protein [Escherichia coli]EFN5401372.1 hypothetical protein [Escherichia coli]EHI0085999.1 hypothetical protein [Escherichia coli]EKG6972934.1 hypothetical protein [Escherichia coli]MGD91717.1 hypothetical protein [Escherichia coli]QNB85258.1 hypothetical protein H5C80_01375 [Escherichia coli]